jgi:hypothetical protein
LEFKNDIILVYNMKEGSPIIHDPITTEKRLMVAAATTPQIEGAPSQDPRLAMLSGIAEKFSIKPQEIVHYVKPDEALNGYAIGGSESLVLFVTPSGEDMRVRKIWSEALISVKWDPDGKCVMSPPLKKAKLQIDYLNGLPDEVVPYFPKILNQSERTFEKQTPDGETVIIHEITADQSYIEGIEVSSFIRDNQPKTKTVAHIHKEIFRCLGEKIHKHRKTEPNEPTVEISYLDKIEARLKLSRETAPSTFTTLTTSDYILIDNKLYRNIPQLLDAFRDPDFLNVLEPKLHCLVMGDTNTENVKITKPEALKTAMEEEALDFTYDDLGIKFLDPRAIGFNCSGGEVVDDPMYDNKPIHNSLGNYDVIHGEHFTIESMTTDDGLPHIKLPHDVDHPFKEPYRDMEQHFPYIMEGMNVYDSEFQRRDPNWIIRFAFVMGTHFAAMPPFHFKKNYDGTVSDDCQSQKRAISVYCEGIKWLNTAHDMLNGDRKELFGIPVPAVPKTVFQTTPVDLPTTKN